MSLPSADDLFRATEGQKAKAKARAAVHAVPDQPEPAPEAEPTGLSGRVSGRVKHDEKVTIYVTSDELLDLEHARLALRSQHGLVVDRGRLVREALALVLADLEQNGEASALVRRLTEE